MATNPNWPVVTVTADFSQGPPNNVPGVNAVDINSGTVAVTEFTTQRGRQHELDKFQAGTAKLTISDPDEKLNPANGSSPWNSGVNKLKPNRLIKIQAQWPPVTGTTYDVWTGYVERYPMTWDDAGIRGVKPLTAVDAMSVMSRAAISQSYDREVAADSPVFTIPFDDTASPARIKGLSIPAMGNFLVQGSQVQFGGDAMADGAKAVSVSQQVQDFATVPLQFAELDARLPAAPSLFSLDLGNSTIEMWIKLKQGSALCCLANVVDGAFYNPNGGGDFFAGVNAFGGGAHFFGIADPLGIFTGSFGINVYPDGKWHHWVAVLHPNAGTPTNYDFDTYIDGTLSGNHHNLGPIRNIGINSVHAHAATQDGDYQSSFSTARWAVYNYQLSTTRIAAHANRGLGFLGEAVSDRATRLLNQYWSSDPAKRTVNGSVGGVYSTSLSDDSAYNNRSLLDVLEEITLTDSGRVYVNKSGSVIVEAKNTRDIANIASVATFGELELPYTDISYEYDSTFVFSQSNLTSPAVKDPVITINAAAQADYGQRILSQTMQTISSFRLIMAGLYFKFAYSDAHLRVEKMVIDPSANTALWPIALGLEISQRVTVKRRTSAGTVISADYYVEQINHTVRGEGPSWITEVQMSPVLVNHAGFVGDVTYGVVGSTAILAY